MSRRFGRNQKRRFREELAKAREAYDMQSGLLQHVSDRRQALEDEIAYAKRVLRNGSVMLEPAELRLDCSDQEQLNYHTESLPNYLAADDAPISMVMEHIPLSVLLTDSDIDQFSDRLHFRVRFADGQWRYAITKRAIQTMPKADLIRRISQELARAIADELKARIDDSQYGR